MYNSEYEINLFGAQFFGKTKIKSPKENLMVFSSYFGEVTIDLYARKITTKLKNGYLIDPVEVTQKNFWDQFQLKMNHIEYFPSKKEFLLLFHSNLLLHQYYYGNYNKVFLIIEENRFENTISKREYLEEIENLIHALEFKEVDEQYYNTFVLYCSNQVLRKAIKLFFDIKNQDMDARDLIYLCEDLLSNLNKLKETTAFQLICLEHPSYFQSFHELEQNIKEEKEKRELRLNF